MLICFNTIQVSYQTRNRVRRSRLAEQPFIRQNNEADLKTWNGERCASFQAQRTVNCRPTAYCMVYWTYFCLTWRTNQLNHFSIAHVTLKAASTDCYQLKEQLNLHLNYNKLTICRAHHVKTNWYYNSFLLYSLNNFQQVLAKSFINILL